MGQRSSYEPGTFCWAELTTPDLEAARAFYAAVLGWDGEFELDGAEVAGVREGEPAGWTSFVRVEDAAAAAGEDARIRDPAGGELGVREDGGAARVNDPGCMTWNELAAPDPDAAKRFYAERLGWTVEDDPTGYAVIRRGDAVNGGIRAAQDGEPPGWLVYFTVAALDEAAAAIRDGGGSVEVEPFQSAAGRVLVAKDPQGARFALFEGEVDP